MYHALIMSGQWYASGVSHLGDDDLLERIRYFAEQGTPSILIEDLSDMYQVGVSLDDIQIF